MSVDLVLKGLDTIEGKLKQLPELADRVLSLEQKGTMPGGAGLPHVGRTYGQLAYEELQKNAELLEKTRTLRLSLKAASDPVTTGSGRNIITGDVGAPSARVLGLQYAIPQRPSSGTAVEYSRYTGVTGAAAQQAAEGDAKAALRPEHTIVTQTAITIAGYTKMSRQALSDRSALQRAVDVTLRRSVDTVLDTYLTNGTTGFSGGFETLATGYTSLVYETIPDAISEGISTMQQAGFDPNVVVLNPADWLVVTTATGTDGHYLGGSYLGTMPMEMRGLRVSLSPSVDAGKALLIDTAHVELLIVDGFNIEVAYDGNDFTKNLVTVLGEMRVIPIFMTTGAARLITPKAAS